MAIRKSFIPTDPVISIIDRVKQLLKEGKEVRFVNVHCVGSEFRIGGCSLEGILDKHFTWWDGMNKAELTKGQYLRVQAVLNEAWEKQPIHVYEDRGVY